jgi:hypothetical protein
MRESREKGMEERKQKRRGEDRKKRREKRKEDKEIEKKRKEQYIFVYWDCCSSLSLAKEVWLERAKIGEEPLSISMIFQAPSTFDKS